MLEERVAALEGGLGALAVASGQAALHLAIATIAGAGDHVVASRSLYGGSHNLLEYTLPRFGIETTFVDPRDPAAFRAAIRPATRLLFGETIGNPGCEVLDVPAVAEVAHAAGLPLLVDNTFATPWLCRPIELGADLVYHSATKFLSGHGVVIGGVLVDGGRFDWDASGRFPTLCEPHDGFHGLTYTEEFGPAAFITRARREGLRDFGACMAPTTAFHVLQGLETPFDPDGPPRGQHPRGDRLPRRPRRGGVGELPGGRRTPGPRSCRPDAPQGGGSGVQFRDPGRPRRRQRFIERLEVFSHLANVGDAKSLVIHPRAPPTTAWIRRRSRRPASPRAYPALGGDRGPG